jgi:anti-sigma regulatory factor (Ser/Thr protein kinase)/serine/threonine protein phosphatase PrpC
MEKKVIHVSHAIDAAAAHHAAKEMAARMGFGEQECEEIAIVVSELATNQFKHAQGGDIALEPLAGDPPGILVEAVDAGPGIANIQKALADGFSTAGGLGLGLGAIHRLMDVVDIVSQPGQGTHISCKRWLHPPIQTVSPSPLDIGVATRPLFGQGVNGDAFVVRQWGEHALVGVIDGLGHGPLANQAAETARQYVESHAGQPLDALFNGAAKACLATRGVVMALARFDFGAFPPGGNRLGTDLRGLPEPAPAVRFAFASLGNIEVRLLGSPEPANFKIRRGIVGINAPKVTVTEHPWSEDCILILHSDGLTTHWQPEDFPNLARSAAGKAAQALLVSLAKEDDDATVVVVKTGGKEAIS